MLLPRTALVIPKADGSSGSFYLGPPKTLLSCCHATRIPGETTRSPPFFPVVHVRLFCCNTLHHMQLRRSAPSYCHTLDGSTCFTMNGNFQEWGCTCEPADCRRLLTIGQDDVRHGDSKLPLPTACLLPTTTSGSAVDQVAFMQTNRGLQRCC